MNKDFTICGQCSLFNKQEGVCEITVIVKNEQLELTTKENDRCHWVKEGLINEIKYCEQISQNGYK